MCLCCGTRICCLCTCLILAVILIGMLFGFGVFKDGFHKIKDTFHVCDPRANSTLCGAGTGRPFMGYYSAPAPF